MPSFESSPTSAPVESPRLTSLDALRGFTMLWIVGSDSVHRALVDLRGPAWLKTFAAQFDHVPWVGLHFYDLIMPLFLFMVGVAIPYSLDRVIAQGDHRAAYLRIIRRTVLLYILGVIYYGAFASPEGLRLCGTLQRIAACYCVASFVYLRWPRPRAIITLCVAILLGYWALMALVPVPGYGAGDYAEGHNLANWFDSRFLPGRKWDGTHDPEGLLSTICAIASTLIGVLAGKWLRREDRTPTQKNTDLAIAGLVLVAIGLLWAIPFPVIKKIWTSSYATLTGGCSLLMLAAFYWIIDIRNRRKWAMPLVWMGANALAMYMISNIVDFGALTQRFVGGPVAAALDTCWPGLAGLGATILSMALCFWLCHFLYKRKIFIKL